MIKEIIQFDGDNNQCLKMVSEPVLKIDASIRDLITDMIDTLNHSQTGVALAAPQIGVNTRVIVVNRTIKSDPGPNGKWVLINPEILQKSRKVKVWERCLSCNNLDDVEVQRHDKVIVSYHDMGGKRRELDCRHDLAQIIEHEILHLDGILISDSHDAGTAN
jgi:peptide deformylase